MSYAFRTARHVLLLLLFPVFFGSVYLYLYAVPHMMDVINTNSAIIILFVYMYDRSYQRVGLPLPTRQVFVSLAATTLMTSLHAFFLGANMVNAANSAAMLLIVWLCLRNR